MNKQKRICTRIRTPEDGLFLAGWIILVDSVILILLKKLINPNLNIVETMPACIVYSLFDFYCPGCGGSRSVAALVHGKFLVCAVNFPLVAYSVIMYLWFMISQSIQRISCNRFRIGLRWRHAYLWMALIILIVHFVLKNILYIVTGVPPFLPLL